MRNLFSLLSFLFFAVFILFSINRCSSVAKQVYYISEPVTSNGFSFFFIPPIKKTINESSAIKNLIGTGVISDITDKVLPPYNISLTIKNGSQTVTFTFFHRQLITDFNFLLNKQVKYVIENKKKFQALYFFDVKTNELLFAFVFKKFTQRGKRMVSFEHGKIRIKIKRELFSDYVQTDSGQNNCLIVSTHYKTHLFGSDQAAVIDADGSDIIKIHGIAYKYVDRGFVLYKKNMCDIDNTKGYLEFILYRLTLPQIITPIKSRK